MHFEYAMILIIVLSGILISVGFLVFCRWLHMYYIHTSYITYTLHVYIQLYTSKAGRPPKTMIIMAVLWVQRHCTVIVITNHNNGTHPRGSVEDVRTVTTRMPEASRMGVQSEMTSPLPSLLALSHTHSSRGRYV